MEAAWNFINKLWNASRFVMMNLPEDFNEASVDLSHINVIDTWLLQKLNTTITNVSANMEKYEFAIVGNELLSFIWDDFCSWYIELSKSTLLGDDEDMKQATRSTLFVALDAIVKLLHPFMPFVTEEIYQTLHQNQDISICTASWPVLQPVSKTSVVTEVEQLISVISTVRELRNARSIKNSVLLKGQILDSSKELIEPSQWIQDILLKMVKLEILDHLGDETMVLPILSGSLILSNEGVVDKAAEIEKLSLEAKKLSGEIDRCKGMLSNPNFTAKAPVHKVEAEEAKLAEYERQYQIVSRRLEELTA